MNEHQYMERTGMSGSEMEHQLGVYAKTGDFDHNVVDIIFLIVANMLDMIVYIDDRHLDNMRHSFKPFTYSPEKRFKVAYLERTSATHYNALIPMEYTTVLSPMFTSVKASEQKITFEYLKYYIDDGTIDILDNIGDRDLRDVSEYINASTVAHEASSSTSSSLDNLIMLAEQVLAQPEALPTANIDTQAKYQTPQKTQLLFPWQTNKPSAP